MDYRAKDFAKLLKKNSQSQRHDFLVLDTDCMRVYDRNIGEFPVTVDLYGSYARVVDYGEQPMSEEKKAETLDLCSRMLYVDSDKIVYVYRAKRQDKEQHEKTENSVPVTVHENGLLFDVDLAKYADTGLFLDHNLTRQMIQSQSANADVLNLFSYTGAFSVYAARGLANTVTSVDLSATYTAWAEKNLLNNGYTGKNYSCICQDATVFVREAIDKGLKYDIIIFDPPSFSNSHKMEDDFDVQRDFVAWIKNLQKLLKKTGFILFSTNLGTFTMDKRRLRGLSVKEITYQVTAPGFTNGRKGAVRSWIMVQDDSMLSLDWSEDAKSEKTAEKKTDRKVYGKNEYKPRSERRDDGERKSYRDDRPRRSYSDRRDGERKSYRDDRPRRSYSDNRSERRSYDDRPRYSREDRPRYSDHRDYDREDRPRYNREDRPRYSERREDKGERDYKPRYSEHRDYDREDRPRRSYSDNRSERRSYDDRPRYNSEDRPRYSEHRDNESKERRYSSREEGRSDYKKTDRSSKRDKPYGYDSFKPARSRNDNPDFFWNNEDN